MNKVVIAFIMFFVCIFAFGIIWRVFTDFTLVPIDESFANISSQYYTKDTTLSDVFNFLWLASLPMTIILIALELAFNRGEAY